MRKLIICFFLIAVGLTWLAYDATKKAEIAQAQVEARDTIIERQAATIAAQARQIRNLEGTVRDNVTTIEQLLGGRGRPEPVSRGYVRGVTRLMTVTAYTAGPESTGKSPSHPAYGVTATGRRLTEADAWRVAAADPEHYPAGTKIFVTGVGLVTILDTGAAVQGSDHIDLFVGLNDTKAAYNWGVKRLPVKILGGTNIGEMERY